MRFSEYCSSFITPQMTLLEKFNALLKYLQELDLEAPPVYSNFGKRYCYICSFEFYTQNDDETPYTTQVIMIFSDERYDFDDVNLDFLHLLSEPNGLHQTYLCMHGSECVKIYVQDLRPGEVGYPVLYINDESEVIDYIDGMTVEIIDLKNGLRREKSL